MKHKKVKFILQIVRAGRQVLATQFTNGSSSVSNLDQLFHLVEVRPANVETGV